MFNIFKAAASIFGGPLGGIIGSLLDQIVNITKRSGSEDAAKVFDDVLRSQKQFQNNAEAPSARPLPFSNNGADPSTLDTLHEQLHQQQLNADALLRRLSEPTSVNEVAAHAVAA